MELKILVDKDSKKLNAVELSNAARFLSGGKKLILSLDSQQNSETAQIISYSTRISQRDNPQITLVEWNALFGTKGDKKKEITLISGDILSSGCIVLVNGVLRLI